MYVCMYNKSSISISILTKLINKIKYNKYLVYRSNTLLTAPCRQYQQQYRCQRRLHFMPPFQSTTQNTSTTADTNICGSQHSSRQNVSTSVCVLLSFLDCYSVQPPLANIFLMLLYIYFPSSEFICIALRYSLVLYFHYFFYL